MIDTHFQGFTVRRVQVVEYGRDKTRIPYCIDFKNGYPADLIIGGFTVESRPEKHGPGAPK